MQWTALGRLKYLHGYPAAYTELVREVTARLDGPCTNRRTQPEAARNRSPVRSTIAAPVGTVRSSRLTRPLPGLSSAMRAVSSGLTAERSFWTSLARCLDQRSLFCYAFLKRCACGAWVAVTSWPLTCGCWPQPVSRLSVAYSDVRYVEELIGKDTINTVPPATLQAFREHGRVRGLTVEEGLAEATLILKQLSTLGIDLDTIAQQLQTDGVAAFGSSLNKLSRASETRQHGLVHA